MEENGKKWKKSVVDVQIEGVLVRSCLDIGELYLNSGNDLCLDSGNYLIWSFDMDLIS